MCIEGKYIYQITGNVFKRNRFLSPTHPIIHWVCLTSIDAFRAISKILELSQLIDNDMLYCSKRSVMSNGIVCETVITEILKKYDLLTT